MVTGTENISMESQYQLSDIEQYTYARWAYSVGKPIISDPEYNLLERTVKGLYPDHPICNRSWSSDPCPTDLLIRLGRQDLIRAIVLSDKTESIPSLNSDYEFYTELGSINEVGTVSYKHDGWNIQANYFNGCIVNVQTRGRNTDSVDVSQLRERFPQTLPYTDKCKIVCELTVSKANFEFCKKQFGNVSERSTVSTLLARPEYFHLLDFHAFDIHGVDLEGKIKFEVLQECGFKTPEYIVVHNFNEIQRALQRLSDANSRYGSPTDGVVYDGSLRRAIRLLAWEEPIYYSYVTGYLEKYGPYRISPSVLIRPILRKGTTQKRLSLTNWPRIIEYNLAPGAPIAFRVASSAIADFDEQSTMHIQSLYSGRWEEFREIVDRNEEMARCLNSQ